MYRFVKLIISFFVSTTLCYGQMVEVQGHRGCRGVLPENTLPAFLAAIEDGANTLEMDLHLTQDGVIVIHHDSMLDRRFYSAPHDLPRRLLISDLTLAQIKEYDCGSKANPSFPNQKIVQGAQIPTLEEVFELVKGTNVRLNLEIKKSAYRSKNIPPEELAQKLVSAVKKSGLDARVYYSSFDLRILTEIKKIDPLAKVGFIKALTLGGLLEAASSIKAQIVSPEHSLLRSKRDIDLFHKAGFRVIPWTVNKPERWRELIEMGVDGIITDFPKDLVTFLEKYWGCTKQKLPDYPQILKPTNKLPNPINIYQCRIPFPVTTLLSEEIKVRLPQP